MENRDIHYCQKAINDEISAIKQLFLETFSDSEGADEGAVIADLVENLLVNNSEDELFLFTAVDGERIIAAIIFSPLRFKTSDISTFLLSPVAVHTDYQQQGIGQKLISYGHNELKKTGVQLLFTYGDIKFYSKVGYTIISESKVKAPLPLSYPDGWLGQVLEGGEVPSIEGASFCVDALNKAEYW